MNRLALAWIDVALELQEENRELRRLMTNLLLAIVRNKEIMEYACCQLREFPEEVRRAG